MLNYYLEGNNVEYEDANVSKFKEFGSRVS